MPCSVPTIRVFNHMQAVAITFRCTRDMLYKSWILIKIHALLNPTPDSCITPTCSIKRPKMFQMGRTPSQSVLRRGHCGGADFGTHIIPSRISNTSQPHIPNSLPFAENQQLLPIIHRFSCGKSKASVNLAQTSRIPSERAADREKCTSPLWWHMLVA
jgi:hypothetical protein